jgi:L-fuconolactonase
MIIDAHQHFWRYHPTLHAWIDNSMKILRRDFMPGNLLLEFAENQVDGSIAVQAEQSEGETIFLLKLAELYDFIKAVVGWVDLRADNIEERLAYFSQFDKLAGIRHIVQAEPDPNFILGRNFCRGVAALERFGFTYDILVYPHQLPAVLEFVQLFPNQKFVIDHLAKPYIKDRKFNDWAKLMREIAKQENVYCKVSGLVTEADWRHWEYEDFIPYLNLVSEAFGVDRLMFGSDWPVCLLAASYEEVMLIPVRYFGQFSPAEKAKVMGGNAAEFYLRNSA